MYFNSGCGLYFCRQFGTKCARCGRSIHANDWVRRARSSVYHLACFACDACKRQLSTGEEFALKDGHVLCKLHYLESLETYPAEHTSQDGKLVSPFHFQHHTASSPFLLPHITYSQRLFMFSDHILYSREFSG